MKVPRISKDQLERIVQGKYGRPWLCRLAGGYGESIRSLQCKCTEEEFLVYRQRAKEELKIL